MYRNQIAYFREQLAQIEAGMPLAADRGEGTDDVTQREAAIAKLKKYIAEWEALNAQGTSSQKRD